MYRILHDFSEVCERRNQRQHPVYCKPELLAEGRNQVWSWDITRLCGPAKWTHFTLYSLIDIFSRYIVGWMIAERESAELARQAHRHRCRQPADPARPVDPPCRQWQANESQNPGTVAQRSGHRQKPFLTVCLERQSLQRSPLQDPQVPSHLPGSLRLCAGCPCLGAPLL